MNPDKERNAERERARMIATLHDVAARLEQAPVETIALSLVWLPANITVLVKTVDRLLQR